MASATQPPGQPPEKITKRLEPVPDWAIELTRHVREGFARSENQLLEFGERLIRVERRQADLAGIDLEEVRRTGKAIAVTEHQIKEFESRLASNSERAKSLSDGDLAQDSAIASILTRVETIEENQKTQLQKQDDAAKERESTALAVKAISGFLQKHPVLLGALIALATSLAVAATNAVQGHNQAARPAQQQVAP
jgi:hypothetical protein